ncbi:PorT family protein [Prevotella sp. A2931]|uniref:PorT family protein n=1 Tax=Prevotella illustrans TaxID=2800387 RepID=A0ABS3M3J6_9BACT|nr:MULTISPECIES: porin family protein [Prevotella]MBO1362739.1 PorT family protein [Prevotella illustrans]PTL25730.1 hypothetical protein C3V39_00735 [Prevotella sp. oral taxon 820]
MKKILVFILCVLSWQAKAQIGLHRDDFQIGVNGGFVMSNVGFTPKVNQKMHNGFIGGLTLKYTSEKYFSTICSILGEINYAQVGWTEDIIDRDRKAVINAETGQPETYSRTLNYVQVPIFAHLAWGREVKGMQFFVNLGPQFGYLLSESTQMNFELSKRNVQARSNQVVAQDTMAVQNKFDYGIALGAGLEYAHPKLGHFLLEARYYYGLGNIYKNSKRDYFAKSNLGNIVIKAAYLFDISRTLSRKQ